MDKYIGVTFVSRGDRNKNKPSNIKKESIYIIRGREDSREAHYYAQWKNGEAGYSLGEVSYLFKSKEWVRTNNKKFTMKKEY